MADKIIAIGSVNDWKPGDEVTGLNEMQIARLVELGQVEVIKPDPKPARRKSSTKKDDGEKGTSD